MLPIDPHDIGTQLRHYSRRRYAADAAVIPNQRVDLALVGISNRLSGFVWLCQGWSSVRCHTLGGDLQALVAFKSHLEFCFDVRSSIPYKAQSEVNVEDVLSYGWSERVGEQQNTRDSASIHNDV